MAWRNRGHTLLLVCFDIWIGRPSRLLVSFLHSCGGPGKGRTIHFVTLF